jgi:hypothetical protein
MEIHLPKAGPHPRAAFASNGKTAPQSLVRHHAPITCRLFKVISCCELLAMLGLSAGCSERRSPSSTEVSVGHEGKYATDLRQLPGTRFNVTYTDRTVHVDRDVFLRALKSVSPNRRVFVFEKSVGPFSHLTSGSILFVKNLIIRKVVAAVPEGDFVYVTADQASIPEVIRNGDIHWDVPVNFSAAYRARHTWAMLERGTMFNLADRLAHWRATLNGTVWADSEEPGQPGDTTKEEQKEGGWDLEGIVSGWDYSIHSAPAPDRLNFELRITRKNKMTAVNIEASGYIQNFETSTTMLVQDSAMKYFAYQNKNLNGEANVSWTAVKTQEGKENAEANKAKLRLPTSFAVPLMLGEFPFTLEIREALIIAPVLSQKGDSARGSFRVTYTGTQGFQVKQGQPSFEGKTDGSAGIQQYGAVSRTIPGTCLVAIAFPKIELKPGYESAFEKVAESLPASYSDKVAEELEEHLLGAQVKEALNDKLNVEAAAYFSVGISTAALSSGTASPVPCQGSHLVVNAEVGAEAKVLGLNLVGIKKEVFSRKVDTAVPAIKGCLGE